MAEETYKTKDYLRGMNIRDARIKFKWRTQMINCKFNFKSDPINSAQLWRCDSCQSSIDTQDHILWCPAYVNLREGKTLESDEDLVEYFSSVMKIREKLQLKK